MNTAVMTALVACSLLAVSSIPLGIADDPHSYLHPENGLRNIFPDAKIAYGSMHDGMVFYAPDLGFSSKEIHAVSEILGSGGSILVIDEGDAGRALVEAVSDMEISTGHLYSPFQTNGSMQLVGTQWQGETSLRRASAVFGGEPLLQSKLAWIDENDDGTPDLREPRGEFAVAAREGGLLVVASEEAILDPFIATQLQDHMGPNVWIDENHRKGIDPLGMAPILSGQSAGWVPLLLALMAIATLGMAFQPRLERPKKPKAKPSNPLLEELSP